ncbi:uncharacterized protein PHACADRAFT_250070 [Phanerochaete carnosa HHB-10118-sp]|uniref:Uncharacterized protein n=1 Tax=Phanerochaete carnosa (strain HHB-10118-sp) TaxID=650164 RepID=K5WK43_PHACS|nr:uncharacterized protein PHACADRAFT_250070 [Phanerochaete carnosa HHB-10118-sp]EKM59514.1 hypothetical protein PHACADRAFT_250070 [Phanerochaete carnosa HHB-10118-sp]
MSTQLVAIAREFAFPSTRGLCLYLNTTFDGTSVTPRISDESWQLLWGHLFDPRSPVLQHSQLPIGGKIEFDIDLSKARWYEAWIGMGRRDNVDVPVSVTPSRAESFAHSHWRADSKTSFLDDQTETPDESLDLLNLGRHSRGPSLRQTPKKLSLLDRFENASTRSGSKLVPRNGSPPSPQPETQFRHVLSPIAQGGSEPSSAKKDIDKLVNTWRASATLSAIPMRATGQTSLDPVNMPNDIPIDSPSTPGEHVASELDLEDFQWSVTSLGPPDYDDEDLDSLESWRLPSVHLDRRLEGSVCLTPTTCTSFGPPDWDDDYQSYVSVISRLPSPDLATRVIEDCPPTPSTATSWGAPLSYPRSPSELSFAPSVDIGQRCVSAVPMTPSTATSWGPPLSWPPSPTTPYHVHTPDVGQRTFDDVVPPRRYQRAPPEEGEEQPWRSVWPYNSVATEDAEGEGAAASPYSFTFPRRPSPPPREADEVVARDVDEEASGSARPFPLVWPYYNTAREETEPAPTAQHAGQTAQSFPLVWPYYNALPAEPAPAPEQVAGVSEAGPSSLVWPYYVAHTEADAPAPVQETRHVVDDVPPAPPVRAPKQSPFKFVFAAEEPVASTSSLESEMPEEVTPAEEEFAAVSTSRRQLSAQEIMDGEELSEPESEYSDEDEEEPIIRPAPAVTQSWSLFGMSMDVSVSVDVVVEDDVHREEERVYVDNNYAWDEEDHRVHVDNAHVRDYEEKQPGLDIEASVRYPYFDIYPAVYPHLELYPEMPGALEAKAFAFFSPIPSLPYPAMSIYSPVYPSNVQQIYPSIRLGETVEAQHEPRIIPKEPLKEISVRLAAEYPHLSLYSPIYPYRLNFIYPADVDGVESITVRLPAKYPALDLYPPVYPYNVEQIYPPAAATSAANNCDVDLTAYPWSMYNIYTGLFNVQKASVNLELQIGYPYFQLYKPVYPHNVQDLYPAPAAILLTVQHSRRPSALRMKTLSSRSSMKTLQHEHGHVKRGSASARQASPPPVPPLPQNVASLAPINPTSHLPLTGRMSLSLPVRLSTAYPRICPYPSAYPYFDLYPEVVNAVRSEEPFVVRAESRYPMLDIYPPVYPHFEIYPQPSASQMGDVCGPARSPAVKPAIREMRHRPTHSHAELHESVFGTTFAPRRKPRYTHADLHQMAIDSVPLHAEESVPVRKSNVPSILEEDEPIDIAPATQEEFISVKPFSTPTILEEDEEEEEEEDSQATRTRAPSVSGEVEIPASISTLSPSASLRRLPTPPIQSQVGAPTPSPPPSIRSRGRSGTVSTRPPLPTPPSFLPPTPLTSPLSSSSDSPSRAIRKLPAIPGEAPNKELPPPPARPVSMRPTAIGLPSDPAAGRRASALGFNRPPPFAPLPPVPEPSAVDAPAFRAPPPRLTPLSSVPEIVLSGSQSATLPRTQPLDGVPELSRSHSVPSRPLPRVRRGSVVGSPGTVAGLAKNWNTGTPVDPALSQFPSPPRAPLPPAPNSRPVSKLDRSRYPLLDR